MLNSKVSDISVENARIGFRNFSGKEGKYNVKGNRNFTIFLETDLAKQLEQDGWNVKWLDPRDPEEEKQGILQVKVAFNNYPPKILLYSDNKRTEVTEESINILDWAEIDSIDLIIRPYHYNVNGKEGIKAYLKKMYITLVVDRFAEKYKETPDSAIECSLEDGTC